MNYLHGAADVMFKCSGFSLQAEGIVRKASIDQLVDVTTMTTEWSRSGWGYVVQAGMMAHRLLEFTARWEQLGAFAGTDPALVRTVATVGNQLGGGVNLYINGHMFKFQTDYVYGFGDITQAGRHTVHIQFDATF